MCYFYVNYSNFNARIFFIHHGECGQCQNGNGMKGSGSNERGFWAGPFREFKHAAESLKRLIKLFNCQPEIGIHSCCQ